MKTLTIKLLISIAILTTSTYAGGKSVRAVEVEILPIPKNISSWYLGLGVVAAKFRACGNDCSYEDQTYGAMLRGGYEFNEYFGIEARGIRTFLDEGPFGGVPLQHIGLYAKPQYPVSEDFSLYALLGYGSVTMDGVNATRVDVDDSGFQWGLGASYAIGDNYELFLDYTSLASDIDGIYRNGALQVDADALTLGAIYKF